MADVTPVTSSYPVTEVSRHIRLAAHRIRFDRLLSVTSLVRDVNPALVPQGIVLAEKDRPILAEAIAASVDYLITGDKHHFRHLYSVRVGHVVVISPADF
jgi:predicted nucleic acid-binding protein